MLDRWDAFGMRIAWEVSRQSKDPSTQVGCYVADAYHKPVSFGFNGFPRGIADDARLEDRETKYKMILHAEENAILNAASDMGNCTVFIYPFMCCAHCASLLIQKRVYRVVAPDTKIDRWLADFLLAESLLREAGVGILEVESSEITDLLSPTGGNFS